MPAPCSLTCSGKLLRQPLAVLLQVSQPKSPSLPLHLPSTSPMNARTAKARALCVVASTTASSATNARTAAERSTLPRARRWHGFATRSCLTPMPSALRKVCQCAKPPRRWASPPTRRSAGATAHCRGLLTKPNHLAWHRMLKWGKESLDATDILPFSPWTASGEYLNQTAPMKARRCPRGWFAAARIRGRRIQTPV